MPGEITDTAGRRAAGLGPGRIRAGLPASSISRPGHHSHGPDTQGGGAGPAGRDPVRGPQVAWTGRLRHAPATASATSRHRLEVSPGSRGRRCRLANAAQQPMQLRARILLQGRIACAAVSARSPGERKSAWWTQEARGAGPRRAFSALQSFRVPFLCSGCHSCAIKD